MQLSQEQLHEYRERGVLTLDALLTPDEVEVLREAYLRDSSVQGDHRVAERGREEARAVYASHLRCPEFGALVRSPRILGPVRQILGRNVYIYQFKINSKPPFLGGGWAWHRDFTAWRLADNLPKPLLVNVGVLLDEVTEFNGPVVFAPGSHHQGAIQGGPPAREAASQQHLDPDDIALTAEELTGLVDRYGMESVKGTPGTVMLFHPEIVHGSAANISPFPRKLLIMTYNDCSNAPRPLGLPRPEYIVCRDTTPLEPVDGPLPGLPGAQVTA
ncbi:phytanoyl-CoA dioxygenase family protein [Streptomyces sp. NRRL F-5123]|uniref:phytanoyl-CoA dioxygenase family protein n=1 Tax=Streptomyces sp. NRRL F-5123 TaxID=1463856 RepID=UPI00069465FA|nr:phytanoyl-CoA dioxygenase family protein [Streptomyces sp. NRRL F-5123]